MRGGGTVRRIPFFGASRCRMPKAARPSYLFVCLRIQWGRSRSAARNVVMGRVFRMGWVRDIVADTRVPQLACFRLLRLLSDFGSRGLISWRLYQGPAIPDRRFCVASGDCVYRSARIIYPGRSDRAETPPHGQPIRPRQNIAATPLEQLSL